MTDTFSPSRYAFAGMFNPRWDGFAPDHPMLAVDVFMSNDGGDRVRMTVSGPTVDDAVARVLESRRTTTGDNSWEMDEWQAA